MNLLATYKYCGRLFALAEVAAIRQIIAADPERTRAHLSRLVCQALGWYKPDGGLKDMSCRVALLRMHRHGLITLPPPRPDRNARRVPIRFTPRTDPQMPITAPVHDLPEIQLHAVTRREPNLLWREYLQRYHYLGYTPLPGAQMRYFAATGEHILALLGFGAAAWKIAPRDQFIG